MDILRSQHDAMLLFARESDTVVVHSMDRLDRNLNKLRHLLQQLTKRDCRNEFVKECLSFTGAGLPMANLLMSVMEPFRNFSVR